MKKVFAVTVHLEDGSYDTYHVLAKDDQSAREKAIAIDAREHREEIVDFCETKYILTLDGESKA